MWATAGKIQFVFPLITEKLNSFTVRYTLIIKLKFMVRINRYAGVNVWNIIISIYVLVGISNLVNKGQSRKYICIYAVRLFYLFLIYLSQTFHHITIILFRSNKM